MGGVRSSRHERRQLVDPPTAARVLKLASLLELVDERDRVDRLALGVEGDGRSVDLRVALAVEVARVEDLADRPDRTGGEHHRPEDGLLGLEVLRGNRGGLREGRGLDHQARSERPSAATFNVVYKGLVQTGRACGRRANAGITERMFADPADGFGGRNLR